MSNNMLVNEPWHPEDEFNICLQKVRYCGPNNAVSHPRRLESLTTQQWKPRSLWRVLSWKINIMHSRLKKKAMVIFPNQIIFTFDCQNTALLTGHTIFGFVFRSWNLSAHDLKKANSSARMWHVLLNVWVRIFNLSHITGNKVSRHT